VDHVRNNPGRLAAALAAALLAACSTGAERPAPVPPGAAPAGGMDGGVAAARPAPARSSATDPDIDAMWRDPVFQKQFVGGYGINSDIEPRITPDEVAILESVRPLMADDLPGAEAALKEQMKPDCSALLDFTLGGIQFQQDRLDESLQTFQTAVGKFPSFRRAWRNIGLIHVRAGRYDAGIAAFTRMIELGGADGYVYGLLGYAYASKQDYQPAEAAYRNALLLQPENTEWRLGLTQCVFRQEKFEDAATLLDALLERYPDKAEFWLLQAQTFLGMKEPLKAAGNLEVMDKLGKSTVDSLHTLGDIYVSEDLLDLAAGAYVRAVEVDPNQPLARPLHAAELLAAHGAIKQARQMAGKLKEVRGDALADSERRQLLKLDARLSMAEGADSDETAAVLDEIVRLDPLDGDALMLLARHWSRQNDQDRAILYYERAESITAFEVNARIGHAQALVALGRYADAMPLLRRAQELRPRDDVARYLEQVERFAKAH